MLLEGVEEVEGMPGYWEISAKVVPQSYFSLSSTLVN